MSVNLSIKGVADDVAARLRARAERHRRSLQGELLAIVEQAAAEEPPAPPEVTRAALQHPGLRGALVVRRGSKTVEQVAAELRARHHEPVTTVPRAVDLLRQARDRR